jgi:hypothetical protein
MIKFGGWNGDISLYLNSYVYHFLWVYAEHTKSLILWVTIRVGFVSKTCI